MGDVDIVFICLVNELEDNLKCINVQLFFQNDWMSKDHHDCKDQGTVLKLPTSSYYRCSETQLYY